MFNIYIYINLKKLLKKSSPSSPPQIAINQTKTAVAAGSEPQPDLGPEGKKKNFI